MYIIDFERINQLTAHPSDAPGQMGPLLHYKISRKYIDMYLEVYYRGEKMERNMTKQSILYFIIKY